MIDKDLISSKIKQLEEQFGYVNVELYDKNRGKELPSSETIKKKLGVSLIDIIKSLKIKSKEEYLIIKNRPIAISNLKILFLEHGEVSKTLYNENKLTPSSEYISKHYGWEEIVKEANVKLANAKYVSKEELIKELKSTIKTLGYVPTGREYESLRLKPTQEILRKHGYTWVDAMRKCGYRTYSKPVMIKDQICINKDCYRQFTPLEEEIYCEQCFKELRSRLIKEIGNMNLQRLREVCQRLIYAGNKQRTVLDIFNNL